jgi:hypothetical protein
MLHPPGFYFVKKLKRFVILSPDKSSERNLSSSFDIKKPRRMEHLQSEDPYFNIQPECTAYFIFRHILTTYLQAMNNLISKLEKVDARKMFDVPKIKRSCLKSWSN